MNIDISTYRKSLPTLSIILTPLLLSISAFTLAHTVETTATEYYTASAITATQLAFGGFTTPSPSPSGDSCNGCGYGGGTPSPSPSTGGGISGGDTRMESSSPPPPPPSGDSCNGCGYGGGSPNPAPNTGNNPGNPNAAGYTGNSGPSAQQQAQQAATKQDSITLTNKLTTWGNTLSSLGTTFANFVTGTLAPQVDTAPSQSLQESLAAQQKQYNRDRQSTQAEVTQAVNEAAKQATDQALGRLAPAPQVTRNISYKELTQYGPGTDLPPHAFDKAFAVRDPKLADWAAAGKLQQKIDIDKALVGLAIDLGKRGLTLSLADVPQMKDRGYVDPSTAGVVNHWTGSTNEQTLNDIADSLKGNNRGTWQSGYSILVDKAGNIAFTSKITPEGIAVVNHAIGKDLNGKTINQNYIGIATAGINPDSEQLKTAQALGAFFAGINPRATITTHGALASGAVADLRNLKSENRREPNEGVQFAQAMTDGLTNGVSNTDTAVAATTPKTTPADTANITPVADTGGSWWQSTKNLATKAVNAVTPSQTTLDKISFAAQHPILTKIGLFLGLGGGGNTTSNIAVNTNQGSGHTTSEVVHTFPTTPSQPVHVPTLQPMSPLTTLSSSAASAQPTSMGDLFSTIFDPSSKIGTSSSMQVHDNTGALTKVNIRKFTIGDINYYYELASNEKGYLYLWFSYSYTDSDGKDVEYAFVDTNADTKLDEFLINQTKITDQTILKSAGDLYLSQIIQNADYLARHR